MDHQKQKGQVPKVRKDKKKNTQTGLLMGQNTNVFSQLSATYLQSKSSATEQQTNFANSTQIIQYHDPNINRLIALLRKKADVTKAKAAVELKQQIMKMNEQNIQEFIQTFSHLFMEVIINEQCKQVIDEFLAIINHIIANFKKILIREIATVFGPLLVINKANNIPQIKTYNLLFTGSDQQLQQKAITLLLNKNVMKKFIVFCKIIIECEESHKIGQQNFQRNCSSLLKVIKQFIRNYESLADKKQQIKASFGRFVEQIDEIVSSKIVQQYFKVGGKAKSSFLQFYQTLITSATRHPEWNIDWESYAKIICQNYLDKDLIIQQSLWKYCNKQFIQSSLQFQQLSENQNKQENNQKKKDKQKYWILHSFLPKPDQKLLSVLKIGGQTLYKELPSYCSVFPYTSFESVQSHKSAVNKITYIRKLMQTLLELEDENQARIQCYSQLAIYFIKILRNSQASVTDLDQKKQQQIRSLAAKAQKQIINNLQDRFYKNPPTSRNSLTFYIPAVFCKLLEETQPNYDFNFDKKQTFPLYCSLKNSEYCTKIQNRIYQNCKNDQTLLLQYLQNFPAISIEVDMSQKNERIEQTSKIFLLSQQSRHPENWFKENWDVRKKLIVFDPRITAAEIGKFEEQSQAHKLDFKPNARNINLQQSYINPVHDQLRLNYFVACLKSEEQLNLVVFMLPLIKQILMDRNNDNKVKLVNQLLQIQSKNIERLNKRQWIVSQNQILRLKVVAQIVFTALSTMPNMQNINKQLLNSFLSSYCNFALTIYNYKLQAQAEQLLKLLGKSLYNQLVSQRIMQSVRDSIKIAYQTFSKSSNTQADMQMKQGVETQKEKQRKNRLSRVVNFFRKLLWYGLNKKNDLNYWVITQDILNHSDWKYGQYRPDLWLLLQCVLEIADEKIKKTIAKKIISQYDKFSYFIALLMCCQLVLSLQRHPSAKKLIFQLQTEVLKQIKQNDSDQKNVLLLSNIIKEATSNESFLLIFGAKNLLKNLIKNYQNMSPESLNRYVQVCLKNPLQDLKNQQNEINFNRKCLLINNLCSELPLLDLPNIDNLYDEIFALVQNETNNVRELGYGSILSIFWESSIGIDKMTAQISAQLLSKSIKFIAQALQSEKTEHSINFIRYYGLTILNSFIQIKGKESIKQHWDLIMNQLIWAPVNQGSLLHGGLQSARYKFISRIFNTVPKQTQLKLFETIPQEILKEVKFYKQILDQIQNEDKFAEQETSVSSHNHYENIVNMFIQFAEAIVRLTGSLSKQLKPNQQPILQLLQCPFPGIKKTSFMLLKQMYSLNLVQRAPPSIFLTYLKIDPQITKSQLDPLIANALSGYLYSWQAIIQRRSTIERPISSEQEMAMSLQDYLQSEQLHQPFLKTIFEVLENQLQYSKNQQDLYITADQLVEMDTIVTVEDDLNLHQKIFRLTIRTLFIFVQNFPLFLRDFIDKNKKYRNVCQKLLRNVISDAIFKEQISKIEMREHEWKSDGNFQIYVTQKSKQIYAEYSHDVIRIGLRLVMKSIYPLIPISIQFGEGLKIQEGSRWALMLQTQLHSRNNTIINGILLWKQNIDKKLAGVQECAICYDIVNNAGQLPKKGCKTCKKKFHSVCIMKWFSKSNKSQCPLCKSQFL